jgi:hypothetical protein
MSSAIQMEDAADMTWRGAKLRMARMVDPIGCDALVDHVFVFQAPAGRSGWDPAIAIGRSLEGEDQADNRVRWRLAQVMKLDVLSAENLDGAEVYSEFVDAEQRLAIPPDVAFHPERSAPVRRKMTPNGQDDTIGAAASWFSAKLRIVRMIDGPSTDMFDDCVFTFRAADFATAFDRAVDLGRAREQEYVNGHQERVLWRLVEVVSLNLLGSGELGKVIDVHNEPAPMSAADRVPFDTVFHPERSKPE